MQEQMPEFVQKIYEYIVTYGFSFIAAILIFFVGRWAARLASELVKKLMLKANVEETLASFVKHISFVGIMLFVVIAALNKLGVQTTSFIAVLGAAGLAIGLALQGSLANFAAGVMLIVFKPYKVGDLISAAGKLGVVKEIQIFNTIMSAPDNKKIILPNAKVTGDSITNLSGVENRRVDLVFGISYEDNMKTAKEALEKVVASDERVLQDPAPVVAVSELGDSSVNLVCRPWVKPADYWGVYFDTLEKGKEALEAAGITIPFPQRDVHIYEEKE